MEYPYDNFRFGDDGTIDKRLSFHCESDNSDNMKHIVVGHQGIKDLWYVLPEDNVQLDWFCWSDASARFLTNKIIKILSSNLNPIRMTAIIWVNSIGIYDLEGLQCCVQDIMETLQKFPQHKVAFPAAPFVPYQQEYWASVEKLNQFLAATNVSNGLYPYNINKTIMKNKKGKGYQVKQENWDEYKNREGTGTNLSPMIPQYVRYIRNYHRYSFDKQTPDYLKNSWQQKRFEKPDQEMKHLDDVDLRKRLLDLRSIKTGRYGSQDTVLENQDVISQVFDYGNEVLRRKVDDINELDQKLKSMESQAQRRSQELVKMEMELQAREKDLKRRKEKIESKNRKLDLKMEVYKRKKSIEKEKIKAHLKLKKID